VNGDGPWGGDPLPTGLTPEDRIGWEVVATLVLRMVPDPDTGKGRGLALEYESAVPKLVLAHQLMGMVQDLMTHDDFQDGVPLQNIRDAEEPEDGT
jgi:hypothetical protein